MMKFKPIIPKPIPLKRINRALVGAGLDTAAKALVRNLEQQVGGWAHTPRFTIKNIGMWAREITTDDAIFVYQDQGTKAHTIVPKRKRALFWPGARHPVKVVRHPGTKAMHYTDKAARDGVIIALESMQRIINGALP